jgi:hypothetical protein
LTDDPLLPGASPPLHSFQKMLDMLDLADKNIDLSILLTSLMNYLKLEFFPIDFQASFIELIFEC